MKTKNDQNNTKNLLKDSLTFESVNSSFKKKTDDSLVSTFNELPKEPPIHSSSNIIKFLDKNPLKELQYTKKGVPVSPKESDPRLEMMRIQINKMFEEMNYLRSKKMFRMLNETRKTFFASVKLFRDETYEQRKLLVDGGQDTQMSSVLEQFDRFMQIAMTWTCPCCGDALRQKMFEVIGGDSH